MDVHIGLRLKDERERFGLSQEEFAALGEVKPRAYWNYEKGKVPPDADFLARLCEKGVDILYVLVGRRSFEALAVGGASKAPPALLLAAEIAAMLLSPEDAEAILVIARRLNGRA